MDRQRLLKELCEQYEDAQDLDEDADERQSKMDYIRDKCIELCEETDPPLKPVALLRYIHKRYYEKLEKERNRGKGKKKKIN